MNNKLANAVKSYVKAHTTYSVRRAIRDIGTEGRMYWRHRSAVRKIPRFLVRQPLKLNLGCGPNCKPGWLNIDLFDSAADLNLDLRRPWPLPDGSAVHIYSGTLLSTLNFWKRFRISCQSPCASFRTEVCSTSAYRTRSGLFKGMASVIMTTGLSLQRGILILVRPS